MGTNQGSLTVTLLIAFLEKNTGCKLFNIALSNSFFNTFPPSRETKK